MIYRIVIDKKAIGDTAGNWNWKPEGGGAIKKKKNKKEKATK